MSKLLKVLDDICQNSDVEPEDSSDSSVDMEEEEEEDEELFQKKDPIHHDDGTEEDEDEEYLPPSSQPPSRPDTRQSATASKRRSSPSGCASHTKRVKQGSKRATSTHGDDTWRSPADPDTEPQVPTFSPTHPPGPRIDSTKSWSPLSLFRLFFTQSSIQTVIQNTNANAERTIASGKKFKWSPFTVDNFYVFVATIIFAGLVRVPSRADLWRKKWPFSFTFPRECMSRDRFEAIFWSIHLSNTEEDEDNKKKRGTPEYDPLFKIRPLYDELRAACCSVFQPGREICINERRVGRKARSGCRRYLMDKPVRFGYKLFVLADSSCGYTWNFSIYQVKTDQSRREDLSVTSVMDLMDFHLLGEGYHLYVDHFFTSPDLFKKLWANRTAACGNIRQTCVGFPRTTRGALPRSAERGEMRWLRKDGLLFVSWKDAREVTVCSSFHKAAGGAGVRRRVKEDGRWIFKDMAVPDVVRDHNRFMEGADMSEALIQYYSVRGKTMKWYKTFFYHFLDIAVVNAYILFKVLAVGRGETPMPHRRFREVLMQELVEESDAVVAAAAPDRSLVNLCMPAYYGQTATEKRRKCVVCAAHGKTSKTPVYCINCNVALCFVSDRNCFMAYHLKV